MFVIIFFGFPETKNRTIEEVALVFDGPDVILQGHAADGENGDSYPSDIEIREDGIKD